MTRDSNEQKKKLSRGSSLFSSSPQVQLRTALRTNDFTTFKKLINEVDREHVYEYPDYKTCLEIAVSEPNKQKFVELLLQLQVNVNEINETHGLAPIHFAVENGNKEALKLLLEDDRIDVNNKSKGNTALLLAIKKFEELENDQQDRTIYEEMVELLLKSGCNSNSPDLKGVTPIYCAAKQRLEKVITLILDHSRENGIDLDTYKDRKGKTARDFLNDGFPHLLAKFDANARPIELIDNDKLFSYLNNNDEDNFIRDFMTLINKEDQRLAFTAHNGRHTMLQLSTEKGFEKVVATLLEAGADPNATFSGNTCRPVGIACKHGFHKILQLFINHDRTLFEPINDDSLIQITLKGMRCYHNNPKADFKECLKLLFKHVQNIDINYQDSKKNTALHYAARNGDSDAVLELLRKGACIGLRNVFNEPPVADINAKTLETYLDECITTNGERPSNDDYEIQMKYSFLVYPNNSEEDELNKPLMNVSNNNLKHQEVTFAPETDALLYMTQNEELRPLLKHPVITSFLYLKWQRISCLFHGNITFYFLFWLCLILYIIMGYGVDKKQAVPVEALNVITKVGVVIGLILLIIRELFQMLVSPSRYLRSIENWMEIALIFVTISIVCYDSAKESTKQQLSAVAILLSSAELVLLIGQFPTLSTNIVMLKTVSWNFFKFLLWYCILIIAFALSFYILFKDVDNNTKPKNSTDDTVGKEEEEEDFFEDPGRSLFKTIVMLTGEFDASSIKFSTFPVTSHIIFMVFVFMIPIVLFNLLNGLAVSDTQAIRANAELVGHISRIKLISYFESVLLGTSTEYTKPGCWSCLPNYMQNLRIITPRTWGLSLFAKRITLFPHYIPKYKIIIKPNQDNRFVIPQLESLKKFSDDEGDIESGQCCFESCQNNRLDPAIVKRAKFVVSNKTNVSEFDLLKQFVHGEIESVKAMMFNRLDPAIVKRAKFFDSNKTNVSEFDLLKQFVHGEIESVKAMMFNITEMLEMRTTQL